ncbi:MAG TPA: murein L,D-transpeptidase catalytic domain family protein [Sphingobium sp.]|nr:murein L,D-transpeptidase catalytic domain family protein [Sphingobium sp.]
MLAGAVGVGAAMLMPRAPACAASPRVDPRHVAAVQAAFERLGDRIAHRDRAVLVDFARPSAAPRLFILDMAAGTSHVMPVAHGRGSDPANSGWLRHFSNVPGSAASCRGAFASSEVYEGQHGRSQRLIGLDPTNDKALDRAIVIHSAWYAEPGMIATHGRLGRSEGCFTVSSASLPALLAALGPGRLLLADRF